MEMLWEEKNLPFLSLSDNHLLKIIKPYLQAMKCMIQEKHHSLILNSNAAVSPCKTREEERNYSFTHFPLLNTEKLTLWEPGGEKSDNA